MVRSSVVTSISVLRPDVLREVSPRTLARRLVQSRIQRVWRRAKNVILDFEASERWHLVVQPRFTGGLIVEDQDTDPALLDYLCLTFSLQDKRRLHYRDVRRLGTVSLMSADRWREYSGKLGPEPLDPALTPNAFSVSIRSTRRSIKKALMDPVLLAGVGNIYANESLWHAGISPFRSASSITLVEAERLLGELRAILRASIAARGTSFRDYRDATGRRGSYVASLAVYGRGGQPCLRCGSQLDSTHEIDGRSTVFCSRCQG